MTGSDSDAAAQRRAQKRTLRATVRRRRRALAPAQLTAAAQRVAAHAPTLPGWRAGARLAAYRAADGELDPEPLLQAAAADGLLTYLPRLTPGPSLRFHPWRVGDALAPNRYGIGEPLSSGAALDAAALDILVLPLVAFSADGTRLGMGAGYYDRVLASGHAGFLLGLAYDWQEHSRLPRDPWDVPLDAILTESGWRRCR